jgi:phosphatidate cytidylyltransferase
VTTRILVALIAAPIVLAPIWFGGIWALLLVLVVAILGGIEFYNMMAQGDYHPARWLGLGWIAALVLAGWQPDLPLALPIMSAGLILTLIYALFQIEKPVSAWATTAIGAIYIGLMMGQTLALRLLPNGLAWLLYALLITWANDTAAYFVGVTVGRNKLWPRLSPKKTWEGTLGGWLGALLIGALLTIWAPLGIHWLLGASLGLISGILGLFGDLSISMVKRQVGVKDSGKLFPGHGGMLDRLDSVLFVLPFIYQVAHFLANQH